MLEGTTKGNVISTATGLLAGSVAGLYYGISSGDFYKFNPSKINVTLKKSENQEIYPSAKSYHRINNNDFDTINNDGSFKVVKITKIIKNYGLINIGYDEGIRQDDEFIVYRLNNNGLKIKVGKCIVAKVEKKAKERAKPYD